MKLNQDLFAGSVTAQTEGKGKDWYMTNSAGLEKVTDKASNLELGIIGMTVKAPTGNAPASGVVAQVEVNSVLGWFDVTVFHAKNDASNLYVSVDSREYKKADGTPGYDEAIRLKREAKAQILRHVRSLCKDEAPAQAQVQTQAVAPAGIDPAMFAQFQAFMAMQAQAQQAPVAQAQGAVQPSIPSVIGSGDSGAF